MNRRLSPDGLTDACAEKKLGYNDKDDLGVGQSREGNGQTGL